MKRITLKHFLNLPSNVQSFLFYRHGYLIKYDEYGNKQVENYKGEYLRFWEKETDIRVMKLYEMIYTENSGIRYIDWNMQYEKIVYYLKHNSQTRDLYVRTDDLIA